MRKIALSTVLGFACFSEPPDGPVGSTSVIVVTTSGVSTEGSSSSDSGSGESSSGGSSSSEGVEESSSTGFDPYACPEWCNQFECDSVQLFQRCRCTNDAICSLGGFTCHIPEGEGVGHCY